MSNRNCQSCEEELPGWAGFCPFCGEKYRATEVLHAVEEAPKKPICTQMLFLGTTADGYEEEATEPRKTIQEAPVKRDALPIWDADDPSYDEIDFDAPMVFRLRGRVAAVVAASLMTLAAFAGLVYVATGGLQVETTPTPVMAAALTEAVEKGDALPELPALLPFGVSEEEGVADVTYGPNEVVTVRTARGSRYDDVEQRARAITVRLEHIAKKQRDVRSPNARFVARPNGDRYEVVWDDGSEHPFRIMDVTKHDLEKGESLETTANLRADTLTDLFAMSIAPTGDRANS